MKAAPWVHLRHFDREIQLTKEFHLPFAPQPGLKIALDVITTDHPNTTECRQALEGPMPVIGIFEVESVTYYADRDQLKINSYLGCDDARDLNPAARELILGHGFTEWDQWPDDEEDVLQQEV